MVKRTGPTNPMLKKLIEELKKKSLEENVKIWKRVAEILERPTRRRAEINLKAYRKGGKRGRNYCCSWRCFKRRGIKKESYYSRLEVFC